jgi:hypothetical protein
MMPKIMALLMIWMPGDKLSGQWSAQVNADSRQHTHYFPVNEAVLKWASPLSISSVAEAREGGFWILSSTCVPPNRLLPLTFLDVLKECTVTGYGRF